VDHRPFRVCSRSSSDQRQLSFPRFTIRPVRQISHPFSPAACLLRGAVMLKRFVYVLRNHEVPPRYYTGITSDVATRHAEHNAGNCTHTAKYRPWSVDVVVEFADERRALAFERYLKSGSGVAFAHRHLR
jgi:putative endonuclease